MNTGKDARTTRLAPPRRILMCPPDAFDVAYAINPHMRDESGALRRPDRALARAQWDGLRRAYEEIGYEVEIVPAEPGALDMTFAANASYPFARKPGERRVLLSRMAHAERAAEPEAYGRWYAARGYEVHRLPEEAGSLEGAGDLVRSPLGDVVFGGYGFRTTIEALRAAEAVLGVPVVPLKLVDERFYHLDTALAVLDEARVMYVEEAFDRPSVETIRSRFKRPLRIPIEEAAGAFACNAHCPDGRNVLIEASCQGSRKLLADEGFRVRPLETSEFRKAGGSVFCLKAELP